MPKFTTRELTKRGFNHIESKDFRDDGHSFKMYEFEGIYISYTKDEDEYFIDIDIPTEEYGVTTDDVKTQDWYNLGGEFNGCYEVDVDKLIKNIRTIKRGVEELKKKVEEEVIDYKVLDSQIKKEIKECENNMTFFKSNFDWLESSEYRLKTARKCYKDACRYIEKIKKMTYKNVTQYELRSSDQRMKKFGYVDKYIEYFNRMFKKFGNNEESI